ncbi:MAG: GTP cyclohydrolase FolE2 [Thermodesulfobacteriota bacterium]
MSRKGLRDVQSEPDTRNIGIDKVGVKDVRYPVCVRDKKNKIQHTIASINMYVDLPHQFKGTHMSRFVEILNEHRREISVEKFPDILEEMKKRFDASTAHLEVEFPYFIEKAAPVSGSRGLMDYVCRLSGSLGDERDMVLEVRVPVTTLCPCSREISDRGAHNQRGEVRVAVRFDGFLWIEDLIEVVEGSASSPVYSLLKRDDEKYVTERSYDNPMFVEDVVREAALNLGGIKGIKWARIEAENRESIHNHSAYALVEKEYG